MAFPRSRLLLATAVAVGLVPASLVGVAAQDEAVPPITVADVLAGTASGPVTLDGAALLQDAPSEFYFSDGTGVVEIELERGADRSLPLMTLVNIVGETDGREIDVTSWTTLEPALPMDSTMPQDVVAAFQGWVQAFGAATADEASASLMTPASSVSAGQLAPSQTFRCGGVVATRVGTDGPNKIYGTNGRDVIVGLGGNDEIYGRGGDDLICGGEGNEDIEGGPGNDTVKGEGGNDELYGQQGNDVLDGGPGFDEGKGGPGNDTCRQVEERYGC